MTQCTEWFCEECVLAENEGIDFGQEILFRTRGERGEFKLFNEMYEHNYKSFHHNFQLVLPSLIVLLSKVGQATAAKRGDSRSVHELSLHQVKRRHMIGQTLPCLSEIRTWLQLSSCVAFLA